MNATIDTILDTIRAAGLTLQAQGNLIRACPKGALTPELRTLIRAHRNVLLEHLVVNTKVNTGQVDDSLAKLRESFDLVTTAFKCSPSEIHGAWALAIRNPVTAMSAFHADAALIRAGWRPDLEHVATFRRRTGLQP